VSNPTNDCNCDVCATMKNPVTVHLERRMEDGFSCVFAIIRDGKTQNYRAVMEVEVTPDHVLTRGADFKMRKGVPQKEAVRAIIVEAAASGVLDEMLEQARAADEQLDPQALVEGLKADLTRMFQQAAQEGVSPGDALRQRLAEMRREADREMAALEDPFRPVQPKTKQYLN
jgi:hypothetical protein